MHTQYCVVHVHTTEPGCLSYRHPSRMLTNRLILSLIITIKSHTCKSNLEPEDEPDNNTVNGRHTFCPLEHRDTIVKMMERHFCAHPLIPGYSAPTLEGIKSWAVKQIYEYCVHYDLPNLWAYLWENWYRRGRWELWAWSGNADE